MKKYLTTICILSFCWTAKAQTPAAEVLNSFVQDTHLSSFVQQHGCRMQRDGDKLLSTYEAYTFDIPLSEHSSVQQVANALRKQKTQAYMFEELPAGTMQRTIKNIAVDDGPDVSVGSHSTHNYLTIYFRSPDDSLRRYAYLLAWYNDADRVKGSVYMIYGQDPARKPQSESNMLKVLGHTVNINNNGRMSFNSNSTRSNETAAINTSSDFLQEFTRLYTLFIGVHGSMSEVVPFQNSILVRMDNLVRQHSNKLKMEEECKLCLKMLKAMKKEVRAIDKKPVKGYIDVISKRLKKTKLNVPQ